MEYTELLTKKQVVVTGANGFIGRAVVAALVSAGAHVTAILRSKHGSEWLKAQGVTVILGALDDPGTQRAALNGADALINLAYDVRASGAQNLAVFKSLLDGAKVAGVKRIVHASSIVVYDEWPGGDLTEQSPISTSTGGAYRQTKMAMETLLLGAGVPVAILQPTIVYGPRSALWTVGLLDQLRQGPVVLPDVDGVCNAVYVDDLAQAALRAAALADIGSERFIISGGERLTWAQFYEGYQSLVPGSQILREPLDALLARLGPAPEVSNPDAGPSLAATVSLRLRAIVGHETFDGTVRRLKGLKSRNGPIYPNRSQLELFSANGVCQIEQARARLGYAPQFDFAAGLERIKTQ